MISSQQNSDHASIAQRAQFNDCEHLTKPFNYLDLNKMDPSSTEDETRENDTIMSGGENWYRNGVTTNGKNESSCLASGEDTDSNGSLPKVDDISCMSNGRNDGDKVIAQDHHARRPMNAFLIFCKRHRNIVRERHPNLENRAITKILGDWWYNLDENEKSCYTNLAKEYKAAFFEANPGFKWYKLPAPPLRTITYNRSNSSTESSDGDARRSPASEQHPLKMQQNSGVGTFKLADETQMGGLNSLMVAADIARHNNNNNITTTDCNYKGGEHITSKDELHRVLGETRTFLQHKMKCSIEDVFSFDASVTDDKDNIPTHKSKRMKTSSSSDFDSFDDEISTSNDSGIKKSTRACKGKRYEEFMNAQRAAMIIKRFNKQRSTSISSSSSLSPTQPPRSGVKKSSPSPNSVQRMDFENDHLYACPSLITVPTKRPIESTTMPSIDQHKGDVGDFDLDHKIIALTAHSFDDYLVRKQGNKKKKNEKKPSNGHRKTHKGQKTKSQAAVVAPKTIQEAKEAIVGSQKRKARKESITRRDVQQVTAIVQSYTSPATNTFTINLPDNTGGRCGASDLLMLATMAEVAANYAA